MLELALAHVKARLKIEVLSPCLAPDRGFKQEKGRHALKHNDLNIAVARPRDSGPYLAMIKHLEAITDTKTH